MQLIDTTLRDGSYAIDFKFTARDTAVLCQELERAGLRMIEIGHGVGLGASESGKGQAAESDEGYLKAAAEVLSEAKFGMFCIPGIARLDHVDLAARYGMGFIRIGTNVADVDSSEPFIARAKKHGMFVSANFMKSYATPPEEFAQMGRLTQKFGSDVLCIVDSAGGMLSSEVDAYFRAVQDVCDIPLAFHGHNNMGLAVAHSLRAVELGAIIIDGSLQGLGRSSGNAPTEILVAALDRMGLNPGIDPLAVMDLGDTYIRPLMRRCGHPSLDVVTGYAQFHSSYMGVIHKYSSKYGVDPRRLIIELCRQDRVNAPEELVESIAARIEGKAPNLLTARFGFADYFGNEQSDMK